MSSFEYEMKNIINELLNSLEKFNNYSTNIESEDFKKRFENIKSIISESSKNIEHNIVSLSNIAEWDKLNVSFFGETNAGKSTLIEALINGSGMSIGEGYKDFTRDVIINNYKNLNLIDMPGIEGKEHKVVKEIKEAVNKSHIIFYVIGSNKEPEETTIKKIKEFLKDNAKVYSIINIRNRPTAYKYQKKLRDDNIIIIEKRVKDKFEKLLEKNYIDNITLNAHLALLKNNALDKRFEKDNQKAIEIFGNEKEITHFSNINILYKLLDSFEKNFKNEILITNSYKFLRQSNNLLLKILKEKKDFDKSLREINNDINKYKEKINKIFKKYENEIEYKINANLTSLENKIKEEINNSIEKEKNEKYIKKRINQIQNEEENKLNIEIEKSLDDMENEIKNTIQEFQNRLFLNMKISKIKGEFNLEKILQELEYSMTEVFKEILDIGLSVWGVIATFAINPILGAIAGLLAGIRKLWDWFRGNPNRKKAKAKQKANKTIKESLEKVRVDVNNKLERSFKNLNRQTQKPIEMLKYNLKALKNISFILDEQIKKIQEIQIKISLLLARTILGDEVEFVYIDLQLSRILIIGVEFNKNNKYYISNLFRVKNINTFSSYEKFLSQAGVLEKEGVFKTKNEFYFRSLKSLLAVNNQLNIKKIIKDKK